MSVSTGVARKSSGTGRVPRKSVSKPSAVLTPIESAAPQVGGARRSTPGIAAAKPRAAQPRNLAQPRSPKSSIAVPGSDLSFVGELAASKFEEKSRCEEETILGTGTKAQAERKRSSMSPPSAGAGAKRPEPLREEASENVSHEAAVHASEDASAREEAEPSTAQHIVCEEEEEEARKDYLLELQRQKEKDEQSEREAKDRARVERASIAGALGLCEGHAPLGSDVVDLEDPSLKEALLEELKAMFPETPETVLERAACVGDLEEAMDIVMTAS